MWRSLWVHKGFLDLLHLERRVLRAGLCMWSVGPLTRAAPPTPTYTVRGDTLDRDDLLLLVEEPSRCWRVGQEEEQVDPP